MRAGYTARTADDKIHHMLIRFVGTVLMQSP